MANKAKYTEHSGAKKGDGAYWGRKADAKRESNKARRRGNVKTIWNFRGEEWEQR